MKKFLILIACFLSFSSFAQTGRYVERLESSNKAGGMIVLKSETCINRENGENFKFLKRAYVYNKSGSLLEGCWVLYDGRVKVIWNDGTEYMYNLDGFDPVYSK